MSVDAQNYNSHSFNLVDRSWICVRYQTGEMGTLSLLEVFRQSTAIKSLANDIPTQDFAILRLLLAILERSISERLSSYESASKAWGDLWDEGHLPLQDIEAYLHTWHHAFDLLDDEEPFMQVAGMKSTKGTVSEIKKIIADVPDGSALFTLRAGSALSSLECDEAARWVVHVHAFDTSGIKTGVVGDPAVRGGKSYPIGTGWAGGLGGVYVEGPSLEQTLLLNLVLCDDCREALNEVIDVEYDLPVWEHDAAPTQEIQPSAEGYANLYTWQSRKVLLSTEGERVTGVLLTNGDKLEYHNKYTIEPMTAWRRSKPQEKKLGLPAVYLPRQHHSRQALWRGLLSLLPSINAGVGDEIFAPGVIVWLGYLASSNGGSRIAADYPLRIHATGFEYGVQNAVITEMIDDTLDVCSFLLSSQGSVLATVAKECVSETEQAIRVLGYLAGKLKLAAGIDKELEPQAREQVQAEAYFEVDQPFRQWLSQLGPQSNPLEERDRWRMTAYHILGDIGRRLASEADSKALVGREVKIRDKNEWMSAGKAESQFWYSLRKALSITNEDANPPKEDANVL